MTLISNILGKSAVGAMALGMALGAGISTEADALTIRFEEAGVTTLEVTDGGGNDQSLLNNSVAFSGSFGNFILDITGVRSSDIPGESRLTQLSANISGGTTNNLVITAWDTDFSGGARSPDSSALRFRLNASNLGGDLMGKGFVDDSNDGPGFGTQVGSDLMLDFATLGTAGGDEITTGSGILADPFSIRTEVTVGPTGNNSGTAFDATVIAAVPLPAGGLLLLTALGGVAALRRKRKAA